MITYDHQAVHLLGIPLFAIVVAATFLSSVAGLAIGMARWRKPYGKVILVASVALMSLMVMVAALVLVTVALGTMG